MHQNLFFGAGGAYDAPPDPLVDWGSHPPRHLRRLELGGPLNTNFWLRQ